MVLANRALSRSAGYAPAAKWAKTKINLKFRQGRDSLRLKEGFMNLNELLDYFNGRLEQEARSPAPEITVDKAKLLALLEEVDALKAFVQVRRH